jgi:tryptophanase
MKARAIIILDLKVDDYAASEQQKIQKAVDEMVKDNTAVVWSGMTVKERRGDQPIDLESMKWRSQ